MFRFLRTSSHYFTPSFLMACLIASSQANASKRVVDEREETALFYAVENESTFSDWSKEKYISYPINHDFGKSFDENTRYAIARMPEDQVAYEEAISQIKKRPRNTPKEAYNTILNLAAQGDAQAQMDLGWLHVRQGNDHENLKAAIYHYEAAKKNGHPEANIALGRIAVSQATTAQETLGHEHPLVAENFQQAATHFHDGFLNGHFECTMELGNLIYYGNIHTTNADVYPQNNLLQNQDPATSTPLKNFIAATYYLKAYDINQKAFMNAIENERAYFNFLKGMIPFLDTEDALKVIALGEDQNARTAVCQPMIKRIHK